MASLVWPIDLPNAVKQVNFDTGFQSRSLRTQMDQGPDKTRAIDDAGPIYHTCELDLTTAQRTILMDFYLKDCKCEAEAFEWHDPVFLNNLKTFRFFGELRIPHLGGDRWKATFTLEELP